MIDYKLFTEERTRAGEGQTSFLAVGFQMYFDAVIKWQYTLARVATMLQQASLDNQLAAWESVLSPSVPATVLERMAQESAAAGDKPKPRRKRSKWSK